MKKPAISGAKQPPGNESMEVKRYELKFVLCFDADRYEVCLLTNRNGIPEMIKTDMHTAARMFKGAERWQEFVEQIEARSMFQIDNGEIRFGAFGTKQDSSSGATRMSITA